MCVQVCVCVWRGVAICHSLEKYDTFTCHFNLLLKAYFISSHVIQYSESYVGQYYRTML